MIGGATARLPHVQITEIVIFRALIQSATVYTHLTRKGVASPKI